jgi:hypothetical protein
VGLCELNGGLASLHGSPRLAGHGGSGTSRWWLWRLEVVGSCATKETAQERQHGEVEAVMRLIEMEREHNSGREELRHSAMVAMAMAVALQVFVTH